GIVDTGPNEHPVWPSPRILRTRGTQNRTASTCSRLPGDLCHKRCLLAGPLDLCDGALKHCCLCLFELRELVPGGAGANGETVVVPRLGERCALHHVSGACFGESLDVLPARGGEEALEGHVLFAVGRRQQRELRLV